MKVICLTLLMCCSASILAGQEVTTPPTTPPTTAAPPTVTDEKPMSFWMDRKMKYSESILRGLATGDFELIRVSAQQMRALTKVEGFVRGRNPDYRENIRTFERMTGELVRQAERKNIDGVVLTFNQVTVNCVRCHQSLRHDTVGEEAGSTTDAKQDDGK